MMTEIRDYDNRGNLVHFKGYKEWWAEYDENNNQLTYKDSTGYYWRKEYDENNNNILYRDSNGNYWSGEYDENNNNILEKSRGYGEKLKRTYHTFDKNNKKIYSKWHDGTEEWFGGMKYQEFLKQLGIDDIVEKNLSDLQDFKKIKIDGQKLCFLAQWEKGVQDMHYIDKDGNDYVISWYIDTEELKWANKTVKED